ncbi:UNVERIFIED_CONTAM: hypothetical protein FKN15_059005 [Acipenser sinensis]
MQNASDVVPSGMLSVVGRPESKYNYACLEARNHCKTLGVENPVCVVANYLFPDGRVIAGHLQALEFLQKNSRKFNFLRTKRLPVSGAFHTALMEPAVESLTSVLKKLVIIINNNNNNNNNNIINLISVSVREASSGLFWGDWPMLLFVS